MIGYDELLHARVEQLRRIEETLDAIDKALAAGKPGVASAVRQLLFDLRDMIAKAEREHAEF